MTAPAKVLFISTQPYFEWRGSPIRVKFNQLALERQDCEVDLLAPPIGADDPDCPSRVIRVWALPGVKSLPIGPSPAKLVFDLFLLVKAVMLMLRHRYDVVHGTEEGGMIAWLVSRLGRAKCVYEKHSDPASYRKKGLRNLIMSAYRGVERFTARHADAVICTGPGLAEQARRYAPEANINHIPDIPSSLVEAETDRVQAVRGQLLEDGEEVLVTYVGSFALYQGIDLLFETIPLVLAKQHNVRFLVIGGRADEIEFYRARLGADATRVSFAGLIDPNELPHWLAASDIVLAPRRAGINTPLKILDYFKANVAIVATDTDANRLILDEQCARLCQFDADAFAEAISELARQPEQREKLAAGGHERYLTRFNFSVFSAQIGEVYGKLLERN